MDGGVREWKDGRETGWRGERMEGGVRETGRRGERMEGWVREWMEG